MLLIRQNVKESSSQGVGNHKELDRQAEWTGEEFHRQDLKLPENFDGQNISSGEVRQGGHRQNRC